MKKIKIAKKNKGYAVYVNNKLEAQGFITKHFALHAVWVLCGSQSGFYYIENKKGEVVAITSSERIKIKGL